MRYFVTGCAGFIGSHLTDTLLAGGHDVVGYDNFSTGLHEFLIQAKQSSQFTLIEADLLDRDMLVKSMKNIDIVLHFGANADVRYGTQHLYRDLEQNTIATFNVLEAMRYNNVKRIAFASTASIYGEADIIPTPENSPFPMQTSLYGASKLAAEGLIQAFCEGFNFQAYIFRFVSVLGERYTHGHIFDFYKKLLDDPRKIHILGNGKQRKSYLYVQDCIAAVLLAMEQAKNKINIFNLGTEEYSEVDHSVEWICDYLKLSPEREYAGGDRGWIGDNPFIYLDTTRIQSLGWKPTRSIRESVLQTIKYLHEHPWILDKRK